MLKESVLGLHWKDWYWRWNSNTLATWWEELTHLKDPDAGKDWGQEEKGTTEDETVGWHHRLNGHEFEWTPGVGDGQGGLACCGSWGRKESDTTEQLNWTELMLLHVLGLHASISFHCCIVSHFMAHIFHPFTWMGFWFSLKILTITGKTAITL